MTTRFILIAAFLMANGCAGPSRADQIRRISPRDAHESVEKNHALLVCAYAEKACRGTHLAGALTLEALEARLPLLSPEQQIIFFCG